jgi:hypothetical protein
VADDPKAEQNALLRGTVDIVQYQYNASGPPCLSVGASLLAILLDRQQGLGVASGRPCE